MRGVVAHARLLLLLTPLVLVIGCSLRAILPTGKAEAWREQLPATWSADLSCPGCAPRWVTLTLLPDGSFRQRDRFVGSSSQGGDEVFHDLGRWQLMQGGRQLVLGAPPGQVRKLLRLPDGNLRLLDAEGREIRSIREYVLLRQSAVDDIAGPMPLLGLYRPQGAGARFSECRDGRPWPVEDRPPADALRRQHGELLAKTPEREPAMLLELDGRLLPPAEPEGLPRLRAESAGRFWPDEACGRALPAQPLLETSWGLVELAGESVRDSAMSQAPRIKLRRGGRLTGTTGCNRLQAAFTHDRRKLVVSRPVLTRMTCPQPLLLQEQALMASLRGGHEYRVRGSELQLLDDSGRIIARFVVSEMP